MELTFAIGIAGLALVVGGAIVFGVIAQFVGETRTGFEWLVDGIAVAIGALFASEVVVAWRAIEPMFDGLAIVPALAGGLILGLVVEVATRFLTGGRYTHGAMSA
jgi:hypothetical protein